MRRSVIRASVLVLLSVCIVSCVSKVQYDRCVSDAAAARTQEEARQKENGAKVHTLELAVADAQTATQERDAKLSELSTADHNLQTRLDEATAMNEQLRGELQRLGKDVDKILSERGTLSKALEDAKSRLDELRKAQAAAEARAGLFRDFARRFKPLADAGQIRVDVRRGQLVMTVSGDLLFETGRSELRPAGRGALMEIAHALQTTAPGASGRRLLVTANVDPPDAKARHVKSTWELTAARAVTVVEYLVSLGVPATSLAAAGAGAFDPLAPNDNADGRAKNRRIEIALLPSSEEAQSVPSAK
jgi:chemotaxis protein MotB